jgi:hypothetical protein
MRLDMCEGVAIRLCASCARNVENVPAPKGQDVRPRLNPNTRGERCPEWYPLPPTPKAAPPAA